MLSTLLILITTMSGLTLALNSLVSLGALLMSTALLVTVSVAYMTSSWLSLILFLIYVSGLLILFGYMLAMAPNAKVMPNSAPAMKVLWLLAFSLVCLTTMEALQVKSDIKDEMCEMFSGTNMIMYWLAAVTLLWVLLIVVSLCFKSPKPFRPYYR